MKVLIVGLGSIARKHVKALLELKPDTEIFALRSKKPSPDEPGVKNLYRWDEVNKDIRFIMICNPTSLHHQAIKEASTFHVPLFIEKPPFHKTEGMEELILTLENQQIITYTAFNMRFHPVIEWLKLHVSQKRVIEVRVYCGSYLPDWRPGRDYRTIYSAINDMGGGVHLDLIHELDYTRWLFGDPVESFSSLSKVSDLDIDSVDCAHYWLKYESMVVSVLLNYYRRDTTRTIEIVFDDTTWLVNLIDGTVKNEAGELLLKTDINMADTYRKQLAYFIGRIESGNDLMNNLTESFKTLKICAG